MTDSRALSNETLIVELEILSVYMETRRAGFVNPH